jgi:DNA-binding transcriptional LysR family regulator
MHRLKIRQLECFLVYMKTGSVTVAAQELHTTQPNASKTLKQMETTLGVPLFSRSGGKLRPTPEAELLYEHVQRLFQQLALIESFGLETSPLRRLSLRIATLATFGGALVPMAIETYRESQPDLQLQVDVLDGQKIHTLVAQGLYDFGLVHSPVENEDVTSKTLAKSIIVCLLPRGHALADRKRITASDLAGEKVISYPGTVQFGAVIGKAFHDAGATLNEAVTSNHSQVVRKFVERGQGVGLVDYFAICDLGPDDGLVAIPFEPILPISLGLIVPQRRPLSQTAEAFISVVADLAQELSSRYGPASSA